MQPHPFVWQPESFRQWLVDVYGPACSRRTISVNNVQKTLKNLTHLMQGEEIVKNKKGGGGQKKLDFVATNLNGKALTLDHDLRKVYADASVYSQDHDLSGNGWELLHPIAKLNQYKKYLEEQGVPFKHGWQDHSLKKRKRSCDDKGSQRKKPKKYSKEKLFEESQKTLADLQHALKKSRKLPDAVRWQIVTSVRQGQKKFRDGLLYEFETCPATGNADKIFLQAAHIVAWSEVNHCELENGILLYQTVHTAMDRGYITYDGNGKMWQRPGVDITHLRICNAQLPAKFMTGERSKWLEQAYLRWLDKHKVDERELLEIMTSYEN